MLMLPAIAAGLAASASSRAEKSFAREVAVRVEPGDLLVHEGPLENSGALEWYSGVRPVIVDGRRSVLAFGASRPDGADSFWDVDRLGAAWRGPQRVWLVTGQRPDVSLVATLPSPRLVTSGGGRRLYVHR
jgi:hypothetical protein